MIKRAKKIIAWCFATLPRKIVSCLVIAGILLSSAWFLLFKPAPVEAGWWDEDWLYRRSVTVTNNTTAQTDVYVEITSIDTSDADKVQADCGDLRFTKLDGTELDYYIVSGCGTDETTVHVKLDTLQAGDQTIYLYYGNPSAVNGFVGTDFSTVASNYGVGAIGSEERGLGPVLWLKFDEGYGSFAYNSTENDAGKLPGTELDTTHPLADGLVGLWLMNEGSGTSVADLSGNGNHATITDMTWKPGKHGDSLEADVVTENAVTSYIPSTTDMTIAGWLYPTSTALTFRVWTAGSRQFELLIWGNQWNAYGQGYDIYHATDSLVELNKWTHIAVVSNPSSNYSALYINGQTNSNLEGAANASTPGVLYPAGSSNATMYGKYDSVYAWERALTASEIQQLYREPFAMISDTGASRISGASWTDSGKFDKALDFDGTDDVVTVIRDANVNLQNKSAYSISTWIYPHSDGENDLGEIIDKGANTYIRVANEGSDGYLDLEAGLDLTSGDPTLSIADALRVNRWSHILLVWEDDDDDQFTIYVNGINMGTSSGGSGVPADDSGSDLLIGGDTSNNFDGVIDEVIIYPYARSAVQAKRNYNKGAAARFGRDDSWITDGLVGYWKMDESSGNAVDSSGAGTTLTNVNTATFVGSKFANGTSLNGSTQYFYAVDNTTLSLTGDVALSAWVYADTVSGMDVIAGKWDINDYAYLLSLEDGKLRMYIDSISNYQTTDSAVVSTSTWTLVTGAYDASAGKVRLYINGREENSSTTGTIPTSIPDDASSFYLGARNSPDGATNYFDGKMDDVRVYNRELSGFEVMRLYDWGPPPIAHWTMDEGSGSSANDSSENANTGTITDATWKNAAECKFGNCLFFNGAGDYVSVNNTGIDISSGGTLSAWIKPSNITTSSTQTIIANTVDSENKWAITLVNASLQGTYIDDITIFRESGSIATTDWHHVVYIFNGTIDSLYIDGVKQSGNTIASVTSTAGLNIGSSALDGSSSWNGLIDDVKIYNYARTQKQIVEDMMGGRPAITETTSSPGVTMGYWKFDEGFGTVAQDSSGRDNDLTHSAEAYTMSGKFGKAWDGDGAKYLSRADDSDFDFTATDDFSISGWFKHSPISSSNDYIIAKHESGGGYKVYMDSDGDIAFAIDDDGTWGPEDVIGDDQGRNYDDNAWHYFAAIKRGTSSIRLYVDGTEIDNDTSLTASGTLVNTDLLYIGIDSDASTGAFDGELDEIKIYRFALSPEEILLDYNKGKAVIMGAVGTELQGAADQKPAFGSSGSQLNTDHPLADGIVGLWLMNEGTGTSVADLSGNGNTGDFEGDTSWTNGKFGSALTFDGTGDYVDVGQDSSLKMTTACTVCAWVKSDVTVSGERNIVREQITGKGYALGAGWTANKFRFYLNAGGWTSSGDSITNIVAGTEYFVCGTYDKNAGSNQVKLWVNGINENSGTDTDSISWLSNNILIGAYNPALGTGWNGKISHVVIFNRALSAEEIKWLYAEPFAMLNLPTVPSFSQNRAYCPPGHVGICNPPVGEWKMDEYSGSYAYDTSANTNKGTLTGDPTWKGSADCKYGSCLNFDGTGDYVSANGADFASGDNISVSLWFKADVFPASDGDLLVMVSKSSVDNKDVSLQIKNVGGSTYIRGWVANNEASELVGATVLSLDTWYHFVLTFDASADTSKLYLNGVQDEVETGQTGNFGTGNPDINIGRWIEGASLYFNGQIDHVMIFDYAMTQEQVAWVYNRGKPVGHWKMDEGEGSTAKDSSENNNTGTLTNMASDDWVTGKYNSALDFDGDNDYVNVVDDDSLSFPSDGMSISAWIKRTYDERVESLLGKYSNPHEYAIGFTTSDSGRLYWWVYDDSAGAYRGRYSVDDVFDDNQWHHILVTYDGGVLTTSSKIYIDGVQSDTDDFTSGGFVAMENTNTPLTIGSAPTWSTNEFAGQIDEVKIYNYELTAQQVKLDYNQGSALRFGD